MIRELVLPQLAMGMSQGTIVEWLVPEGGTIERDAPLVSIETEKVTTELPSPYGGILHIIAPVDTTVPVETIIGKLASTPEEYAQLVAEAAPAAGAPRAETKAPPVAQSSGEGPTGPTGAAKGRIKVSGLARKIAALEGIDLASVTGSGPHGRIVRRDVEAKLNERQAAQVAPAAASLAVQPGAAGRSEKARVPLRGMRGAIAQRMVAAKTQTAQTYCFFEIDVTNLLRFRQSMIERADELGVRVSLNAFYARALAMACKHVPMCNATIEGDDIILWDNVDVSVAVAVPGKGEFESGLLVPVLRNVESKTILPIASEMADIVDRARKGQLRADDSAGHTVTLSSTSGMARSRAWGVSAPILNQPAVLAFQPGTAKRTPVFEGDEVVARDILPCGLTFDHRALDGEPVGRFVQKISDLLANPELMLL